MSIQDAEVQLRLDLEIATLRDKLFNLVAQRNSLSPVSKLPVEILSTIFWMHQQSELAENDASVNWMRVSHVCRQWRQISINLPQLWSHINFQYPSWTMEMVKRSQNLGFIINIRSRAGLRHSCDWNDKLYNIRNFIKLHMSRIREINIDVFPEELHFVLKILLRPFSGPFTKNAPQLQAIRLPELVIRQSDPIPILETFFVHANNLKVLEVTCTRNWDSKLFTSLTHLKVVNPKGLGRPNQVQFLSALERMPQLKSLQLRGEVLPLFTLSTHQEGCGPVSLPELRFLTVEDDASLVPDFLESIKFDTPHVIDIRHNTPSTDFAEVLATISSLPPIYLSSTSVVRGLRLDLSMTFPSARRRNIQVELETWHGAPSASSLETSYNVNPFTGDPFLTLGLSWLTYIGAQDEASQTLIVLSQISKIVSCKNLSVLSLTSSDLENELPRIHSTLFSTIFGVQPDLHTIFVSGSILKPLVKALKPRLLRPSSVPLSSDPSRDDDPFTPTIPFPKLRHLSISAFDFSKGSAELSDCLSARMKFGHKLETLTILNCDGLDNGLLIEKLDKVTNNLAWDRWRLPHFSCL